MFADSLYPFAKLHHNIDIDYVHISRAPFVCHHSFSSLFSPPSPLSLSFYPFQVTSLSLTVCPFCATLNKAHNNTTNFDTKVEEQGKTQRCRSCRRHRQRRAITIMMMNHIFLHT